MPVGLTTGCSTRSGCEFDVTGGAHLDDLIRTIKVRFDASEVPAT